MHDGGAALYRPLDRRPSQMAGSALALRLPGPRHLTTRLRASNHGCLEHDPEKWVPVFGQDHAPTIRQSEMTKSSRSGAVGELLFLDREYAAGLDLHVAHRAGAALAVGKLHVVAAGGDAGDAQALVVVDLAVAVVLALVRTPFLFAGRRQVELLHGVGRQVPEPDAFALVLRGRRSREQQRRDSRDSKVPNPRGLAHHVSPLLTAVGGVGAWSARP